MTNLAELKTLIENNPDCAEALSARDCEELARIASIGRTRIVGITRSVFAMWCAKTGMRASIEDHSLNVSSPLRSVALTLKDFLVGPPYAVIDFGEEDNLQSLNAWKQAQAINEEQAEALIELGRVKYPYTVQEVADALFKEGE